MANKRVY